ncbi:hypothetical protein ACFW5K_19780 [Streptomyces albidoflavus]
MATMMGRRAWYGAGCACCGGDRTRGQVRAAERREWLADWGADIADAWYERNDLSWLFDDLEAQ